MIRASLAHQGFIPENNLAQKYALTERDKATGLDHTWFRKNETQAGRWTSPDPYNGSASVGDPQSWNRYAYVGNDPINFVDPSGLNKEGGFGSACTTSDGKAGLIDHDGKCKKTNVGASVTVSAGGGGPVHHWVGSIPYHPMPTFSGGGGGGGSVGNIASSPPSPQNDDPCAGRKGKLDFSKRMKNHIFPRHIATSTHPGKSKYTFWPWQRTRGQYEAQVASFGQTTFENGKAIQEGNNVVYTYAFAGVDTGDTWLFREVGIEASTGDATNVNTVIVNAIDCQTVISAYPGLPRQFGPGDIPGSIFRSSGWSTQHTTSF